jgi:excisionase family DNA binding protein
VKQRQQSPTRVLHEVGRALVALADVLERVPQPAAELIPLRDLPVSVRQARSMIARGELPAVRTGRSYLVAREDVERVFAPRLAKCPKPPRARESERSRAERQLLAAGIVVRKEEGP